MEDWRLNGQEEYLTDSVLYKVTFPDFWKKAYAEKNGFYQSIVAEAHRFVETMHRGEEHLDGENVQHFWHEHCAFCWSKATTDTVCEFYCTKDMMYWVCKQCYDDFKEKFGWTEKPANELFD